MTLIIGAAIRWNGDGGCSRRGNANVPLKDVNSREALVLGAFALGVRAGPVPEAEDD